MHWFLLVAEQGFDKAQNNVGYMCEHGCGVSQVNLLAMCWYLRTPEQGKELGQYNIACLYREVSGGSNY